MASRIGERSKRTNRRKSFSINKDEFSATTPTARQRVDKRIVYIA